MSNLTWPRTRGSSGIQDWKIHMGPDHGRPQIHIERTAYKAFLCISYHFMFTINTTKQVFSSPSFYKQEIQVLGSQSRALIRKPDPSECQ